MFSRAYRWLGLRTLAGGAGAGEYVFLRINAASTKSGVSYATLTMSEGGVAGPPDMIDPDDPLAAFEGRMGGVLRVVDKLEGHLVCEHKLTSPPVFNGAAAASSRLVLSLHDGSLVCFGR